MDKKYFQELLTRYENNQLNDGEKKIVDTWYDSFGSSEHIPPLQDENIKENLYQSLQNQLNQHVAGSRARIKRLIWPYIAAASLLAAIAVAFVFRSVNTPDHMASNMGANDWYSITTRPGQLKKIALPDSSIIWINSCSELRFKAKTFVEKRDVFLNNGKLFLR